MQVVQPQTPLAVQIGYGAFIALAHALWFGAVALFFSTSCGAGPTAGGTPLDRSGVRGLLVGFGMLLALTQQTREAGGRSTPDCRVLFFMPWQPLFGRIGAHFEVR